MLTILRTQPTGSAMTSFLDASVTLRKGTQNVEGKPDIVFSIKTYEKIAKDNVENVGDQILLPINLFFNTLTFDEHEDIYDLYKYSKQVIATMTTENLRSIQEILQTRIFNTIRRLKLPEKMVEFCRSDYFIYPDLATAGTLPHHTAAKTFMPHEYVDITAISLLSKLMIPIWGEFIKELGAMEVSNLQREKIAFDLIEPTLEEGVFERIYQKLSFSLSNLVHDLRKAIDKKAAPSGTDSSFIITHNGVDDQMFDVIVMATIIVKRMATYGSIGPTKDGNPPNAMVYIDNGVKRTANSRIQVMRNSMNTMPRRELADNDSEDNQSIIDHASRVSKKPIDVPMFVVTAVEKWELPKILDTMNIPIDVYSKAVDYYKTNSFDINPLCQSMVASFIGTRFGGSKCLGYLPPNLYQRVVVLLQIFLIRNKMYDLASLISSKTPVTQIDGATSSIALRIKANLKSDEYLQCQDMIRGFLVKPPNTFGKKPGGRNKEKPDRIDFTSTIDRMVEWLVRYDHVENMAPVLWDYAKVDDRPVIGSDCRYDENIIRNLCTFYLIFLKGGRPF